MRLFVESDSLPGELRVNARSRDGDIMGVRHAKYPVHGVQFHPESVLTRYGYAMIERLLRGEAARVGLPASADSL